MNVAQELKKTVAKVKVAETGSFVAISVGDLIYDMLRVDPKVIKAIDFSRKGDFSNIFAASKKEIADRSVKSSESLEGLHNTYTGYTFERVVGLDFQKRGAEVIFPEKANEYDKFLRNMDHQREGFKNIENVRLAYYEPKNLAGILKGMKNRLDKDDADLTSFIPSDESFKKFKKRRSISFSQS